MTSSGLTSPAFGLRDFKSRWALRSPSREAKVFDRHRARGQVRVLGARCIDLEPARQSLEHHGLVFRRQRKYQSFDLALQITFRDIGALLQHRAWNHHRLTDQQGFKIAILAHDDHPLVFELAGKDAIDGGGIAQTALDALDLDRLVADDLQANIVPLLVQTEMLQPKQYAHPAGAADAGDTESFAAQVLGALDVGTDDEVIGVARVKSGEEFEFMSSGDGSEHGAAAGATDMNAASG